MIEISSKIIHTVILDFLTKCFYGNLYKGTKIKTD